MTKKILITLIILVVTGLAVWLLILNPRTSVLVDKNSGCYQRCQEAGFNRGICLGGGSGIGSGCEQAGGTQIFDRENPIPGCSFEAIGSWEECCCF